MDKLYESCCQCPRNCKAARNSGKCGICGEGSELRIASAGLHFGEEPPVTVFGGSGTIFFTGCTLRCAFCQNYQISQQGMGRTVGKEEFIEICRHLEAAGAENINLITPSHAVPVLAEYLKAARKNGITLPFCWNSSAYEKPEMLELVKDLVDIWLPDLKTLNSSVSKSLFAAADYPESAIRAIKWMLENYPLEITEITKNGKTKEKMTKGVIIRHLFLPGKFEDTADTLMWLKENADGRAIISLMSQYTPVPFNQNDADFEERKKALDSMENRLVNEIEDGDLKDIIEAFDFNYLFYQDLTTDTDWLPDFNNSQPFPNKLAKPVWHWKTGFME